jgi:hypothetical protein
MAAIVALAHRRARQDMLDDMQIPIDIEESMPSAEESVKDDLLRRKQGRYTRCLSQDQHPCN